MRDGDGLVLTNLFLEKRKHAAVRSEDIAEADRHAAHPFSRPGGENQFSHPLGAAHNVRRVHGFVGRNHYKGRAVGTLGHVQQCQQAEDVVADGLIHIRFHNRHVLVRRGMEHDLDPVGLEYSAHALRVREVGDTEYLAIVNTVVVVAVVLGKLMLQVKDPVFILVETQEQFRFVGSDLPA